MKAPKKLTPGSSPETNPSLRTTPQTSSGASRTAGDFDPLRADVNQIYDAAETRIIVNPIADPTIANLARNLNAISLPASQVHRLQADEFFEGLYWTPEGERYALLKDGGYYRADPYDDGDYQIPWPDVPGVTPPILKKVEGKPYFDLEAEWYRAERTTVGSTAPVVTAARSPVPTYLDPELADSLSSPERSPEALRYNRLGQMFVDTPDGTVMVRRTDHVYHQASATGADSLDIQFDRSGDTLRWHRVESDTLSRQENLPSTSRQAADDMDGRPGPSKRARPNEEPSSLVLPARTLPADDWRAWGADTRPLTGESIEIDGKHYRIFNRPTSSSLTADVDNIFNYAEAYLIPPHPLAENFAAFEQMLRTAPQLQPRHAVRAYFSEWRVSDGLIFDKPLTQYIADIYPYMSENSASRIANATFNRANSGKALSSAGLKELSSILKPENATPRYIRQLVINVHRHDPLSFLSSLPRDIDNYIQMPFASADGVQRIEFDSKRFPLAWAMAKSGAVEHQIIYREILEHAGYSVSRTFRRTAGDALMIKRSSDNILYIMFFNRFSNGRAEGIDNNTWLRSMLRRKVHTSDELELKRGLQHKKVIYLSGDLEELNNQQGSLIITRLN
ncbi:hypothetical protein PS718_00159 [Pseudomonas fluorescens]|uniref:Uncharacterized protein n=1 Tax=Pseudomonas fluorescens TaxID=294 RepID=A0A5E6ZL77_PSEFL|nr:hypothetical protein [Pseudomonas fluorescens]VVN66956.1 hypothetical protein PS718_00159 [Pseudomonas fluorescens]